MLSQGRGVMKPRRVGAFLRDGRGVSAIEFALIAPILILMFVGMAALSSTLLAQRRANHATSSIGDLVAQFSTIGANSDLPNAFQAANDIMAPYPTATLQIRVTSIIVDGASTPQPRVNWSCAPPSNSSAYTAYAAGTPITTLPTGLVANTNDSIIMVESTYTFTPPAARVIPSAMTFNNVVYFKPRQSVQVQLALPNGTTPAYSYTAWVSTSTSNPYTYSSGSAAIPSLGCFYQSG